MRTIRNNCRNCFQDKKNIKWEQTPIVKQYCYQSIDYPLVIYKYEQLIQTIEDLQASPTFLHRLYVLRSTIFILVQLSAIYSIYIILIYENHL